ncbi:MAG: hypothetical protein DRI75_02905 [Bacteroidetes bacterium]|nr:MAG: hypothetical protein DRI75_02905 [Bacteroidota bacterium]
MLPFEFLALAISVIMGLAITRLVSGIGLSIRQIRSKKHYWIHSLWIFNILVFLTGLWWGLFKWSTKEDWAFSNFIFLIIYCIIIYLLTDFLVPLKSNSNFDPKKYFLDNRKFFFGILFLTIIMDIVETYLLEMEGLRTVPTLFPFIFIPLSILALGGFLSKNIKINSAIAVLWSILILAYLFNGLISLK